MSGAPNLRHAETHEFNAQGIHTTPRCDFCLCWIASGARVTGYCAKFRFGAVYNSLCDEFEGSRTFDAVDKTVVAS